ncbi:hypothetical protein ACLOJK_026050 [Asimina triloba]
MADRVAAIVQFVKQCSQDDSLEVGDYLKAVRDLCSMELGFKDVQLFLFSSKQNVLLNLIGLHYSLFWLGVAALSVPPLMIAISNLMGSPYSKGFAFHSPMAFGVPVVPLSTLLVFRSLIRVHETVVEAEDVSKALLNCQISERQVCVRWWKLGRWFHGFRPRDESRLRRASLSELAMAKDDEVMGVLNRGAIHEVLRIQIFVDHPSTTWACMHSSV